MVRKKTLALLNNSAILSLLSNIQKDIAMSRKLDQALNHLISLIDGGMEYPDAEWKAVSKFKVPQGELCAAYDEHCAGGVGK